MMRTILSALIAPLVLAACTGLAGPAPLRDEAYVADWQKRGVTDARRSVDYQDCIADADKYAREQVERNRIRAGWDRPGYLGLGIFPRPADHYYEVERRYAQEQYALYVDQCMEDQGYLKSEHHPRY